MKKSRFTEAQILSILKEQETGMKVADLCRQHGISQPTFYQWKSKYSGMQLHELKRLKQVQSELTQYRRIVADLTLQNRVLKDVIEKKL